MLNLKNNIREYLETLKRIQEFRDMGCDLTPYHLEVSRQKKHSDIIDSIMGYLPEGTDRDEIRWLSKDIFYNLDKVCEVYSTANEWMLKDDVDVLHMTDYLNKFLVCRKTLMYLEGKDIILF